MRPLANSVYKYEDILNSKIFSVGDLSNKLGDSFEVEVQSLLKESGFTNLFFPEGDGNDPIVSTKINGGKNKQSEFDAFVKGDSESFEKFKSSFSIVYAPFTPSSDPYFSIVEVKLNSNLLFTWVDKGLGGSRGLFFDESSIFTKFVVINGGIESEFFMGNLTSSTTPHEKYKDLIKILNDNRINVFYKLWSSGESINDITRNHKDVLKKIELLDEKNKELDEKNKELDDENVKLNDKVAELDDENVKLNDKVAHLEVGMAKIKKMLGMD